MCSERPQKWARSSPGLHVHTNAHRERTHAREEERDGADDGFTDAEGGAEGVLEGERRDGGDEHDLAGQKPAAPPAEPSAEEPPAEAPPAEAPPAEAPPAEAPPAGHIYDISCNKHNMYM